MGNKHRWLVPIQDIEGGQTSGIGEKGVHGMFDYGKVFRPFGAIISTQDVQLGLHLLIGVLRLVISLGMET